MKKIFNPKKNIYLSLGIILVVLATSVIYWQQLNAKYNNPDFKKYLGARSYCGQFFGDSASQEQIYKDWQNHTPIDC
jgi:hypothetical protein